MSGGPTLVAHPALRFLLSLLETDKLLVDGFCAFYAIAHFHFSVEIKETGDFFFIIIQQRLGYLQYRDV